LNTDDPGIFECDLAGERRIAKERFGFSVAELGVMEETARRFRFQAWTAAAQAEEAGKKELDAAR